MKLFILTDPVNLECARVAPVGDIGYIKCDACGYYTGYPRPAKRVVEWLEGSNTICSFIWPARLIAEVLVTEEVSEVLRGTGVESLPVEFYQDPKLRKPKRITKRTKPRVWLPYEGPPLYDLWVGTWVHADLTRSSLQLAQICSACGREVYKVEGIEQRKHRWDATKRDLVEIHKPRVERKGIYVHQEDLRGVDIFRLYELGGRIFCTERLKTLIEAGRFTNVSFLEVGEMV
jgi:hypothetical protein